MNKCIIIDDESKARNLLQAIISQYCPSLEVIDLCPDLPTGIKSIKKNNPALVFLDIEMPGHSGLEILDFFTESEINFSIIFTTAYNEYALQAFKLSAIDYLLKPIQHTQLVEAVERFNKQTANSNQAQIQSLKANLNTSEPWENKRIVVPSGQTLNFFEPKEVIMIKGEAAYSELYLTGGRKLLASRNLRHFEDLLQHIPVFYRCHKSYIINTSYILQYVKSDGGYLNLVENHTAGLSTDKVDELMSKLK
jgi:two-component system, LytTR family, response regulator